MSNHKSDTSGWSLSKRDPKFIESFMPVWEWLYRYYFRVQTSGWHHIPDSGQVLLVGSHNGGMPSPDLHMTAYDWFRRFGAERPVYGLMHRYAWEISPFTADFAQKIGAIRAHPKVASAALDIGASLLVYPGGQYDMFRPHSQRHKIHFAGSKGFIRLALRKSVTIIPVISVGAHDTLIILGDIYEQIKQLNKWGLPWLLNLDPGVFPIYLGLPWGLAIGPLPNIPFPVKIHTRVCAPIIFERYGEEASNDREYVAKCYELVYTKMQQDLDCLVAEVDITSNSVI